MCPGLCLSHAGTPCSGNAPDPDHWKGLFMHSAQCVAPGEVIIPPAIDATLRQVGISKWWLAS
jgi:hypothetical protein